VSPAPGWRRLLRLSLGERSIERDIDDELAFHLAMREDKLRRLGLEPSAAHARAHERFGNAASVRDECLTIDRQYAREVRLMEWLESLWSDFQYALRTVPADADVHRDRDDHVGPRHWRHDRDVHPREQHPVASPPYPESSASSGSFSRIPKRGLDTWGLSQQNIALYHDRSTDFEAFAAYSGGNVTIRGDNGPQRLAISRVTSEFFRAIGVGPAIGRPFTAEEDSPGKNTVVILSHGTWQTRFGANPSILGTTMEIDGQIVRVVGVMPPGFAFPRPDVGAWLPMGLDPNRRFGFFNSGIGRLKPGVTLEHAERQTTAIMWDWARMRGTAASSPGRDPSQTRMKTIVRPLHDVVTGRSARPLTVLFAAVALILLIATANVATLLSGASGGAAARDQFAHRAGCDRFTCAAPAPHGERRTRASRRHHGRGARRRRGSRLHALEARDLATDERGGRGRRRPGVYARRFAAERSVVRTSPGDPCGPFSIDVGSDGRHS
jgi:hypothetical protein